MRCGHCTQDQKKLLHFCKHYLNFSNRNFISKCFEKCLGIKSSFVLLRLNVSLLPGIFEKLKSYDKKGGRAVTQG